MHFRTLCTSPLAVLVDDFASPDELAALRRWFDDPALRTTAVEGEHHNETGFAFELPVAADPVARALTDRIEALVGFPDALDPVDGGTLRMRRYHPGEHHPRHDDAYDIAELRLCVTALLVLDAPELGGETLFPDASPGPLRLQPKPGRLYLWRNTTEDGEPWPAAEHLALPVVQGLKTTATRFLYAPITTPLPAWEFPLAAATERRDAHLATPADRGTPLRGLGRRLVVVDDGVPAETVLALRDAADLRGLACVVVDAARFDFAEHRRTRPGDLLYRPAVSQTASRVEQFLWSPGVADLYARPMGVFFDPNNASMLFDRVGLPVARTYWPTKETLHLLDRWVADLGGLPVVVKILGFSGGQGVIRVDSLVTLRSLLGAFLAQGNAPLVCAYVPDAVHWRVFVVGERAVGGYRNVPDQGDFRTSASDDPNDYRAELPIEACEIAVRATRALEFELAGVDVLQHPSGRFYLLEANFPCYFGHAQENGQDIAGAIVDHLLDKSLRGCQD